MLSGGERWLVGLGIVFIIAGLRFLPGAFTSTINAVGVAIWVTTGIGIITARK